MKKRKLFIGNLNYSVTAEKLRSFLASYGTVINVKMVEGKGYAFVEVGSEEQALKIQKTLNESVFEGRRLLIDGVPGTRRIDRKQEPDAQNLREKRPASEPGRKTYPPLSGEEKKSSYLEWKNRKSPDNSQRPVKAEGPRADSHVRSKESPGQTFQKSASQSDKNYFPVKPASTTPAGSPAIQKKKVPSEASQKPASESPRKVKKSRVPTWVREKRSTGYKPKKYKKV